jgi:hypothetical protein
VSNESLQSYEDLKKFTDDHTKILDFNVLNGNDNVYFLNTGSFKMLWSPRTGRSLERWGPIRLK